jgi:hypothetical protein
MTGMQDSRASAWVPDGWYEPPYDRPRGPRVCRCCRSRRGMALVGYLLLALGSAIVVGSGVGLMVAYLNSVQGDYHGQPGAASGVVALAVVGFLGALGMMWLGASLIVRSRR